MHKLEVARRVADDVHIAGLDGLDAYECYRVMSRGVPVHVEAPSTVPHHGNAPPRLPKRGTVRKTV